MSALCQQLEARMVPWWVRSGHEGACCDLCVRGLHSFIICPCCGHQRRMDLLYGRVILFGHVKMDVFDALLIFFLIINLFD